jgi:hypothetical protein
MTAGQLVAHIASAPHPTPIASSNLAGLLVSPIAAAMAYASRTLILFDNDAHQLTSMGIAVEFSSSSPIRTTSSKASRNRV